MNDELLDAAALHLAANDSDWAALIDRVGPCGLKPRMEREPYEALIRAIAYQQLHGRAAEAILKRFLALFPDTLFPAPDDILAVPDETLRACGFSASKIASIRGIAQGALDGLVPPLAAAVDMPDEELVKRLIVLRGIGRWTVEMFLIFTLGRPDILPVDDYGVREGWRTLKRLPVQPKPQALAAIGVAWSPYRSIAAWYLWRAAEMAKAGETVYPNPLA